VPIARGVGFGQAVGCSSVVTYYCSLIAISLHYLGSSFQAPLPWTYCHDDLVQDDRQCVDSAFNSNLAASLAGNMTSSMTGNLTSSLTGNLTASLTDHNVTSVLRNIGAAEQYFKMGVLREAKDIDNGIGLPGLELSMCLLACWVLLFLTLWKGVASSGKVAYFTAIFPYIVLITLLVRGLTLPGAMKGIWFYLTPKWGELANPRVWYAAVTQSFFSLSTGFGALITYSSFNKFRHNSYRDAVIISFADTFTSLLAGFVIFSILGNLAEELGVDVSKVVDSGPGLAFVSYPTALAKFQHLPQLFSVLFFLMLITLGLGSATGLTSSVISIICDLRPDWNKTKVTGAVCVGGFLIGLVYVTPGGQAILELVDYYGGGFIIFLFAIVETVAIAFIYGMAKLVKDIKFMLNITIGFYWKFCMMFFIPVSLIAMLVYMIYDYKPVQYQGKDFPDAAIYAGWTLTGLALIQLPIWGAWEIYKSGGVGNAFRPNSEWGPLNKITKAEWRQKDSEVTTEL